MCRYAYVTLTYSRIYRIQYNSNEICHYISFHVCCNGISAVLSFSPFQPEADATSYHAWSISPMYILCNNKYGRIISFKTVCPIINGSIIRHVYYCIFYNLSKKANSNTQLLNTIENKVK